MADQLGALDLDQLERNLVDPPDHFGCGWTGVDHIALVQRVREAEAELLAWRTGRTDHVEAVERVKKAAMKLNHALNDVLDAHHIVNPKATDALLYHAAAVIGLEEQRLIEDPAPSFEIGDPIPGGQETIERGFGIPSPFPPRITDKPTAHKAGNGA